MTNLNERQEQAVRAGGSVAVTAGAGTGKTHVLAERYHHLLAANGWSPLHLVAVTFTDKAADEMRSRIRSTASRNGAGANVCAEVAAAQISTIHSLAARICRDFHDVAGIPSDFRLLDENESVLWTLGKLEEAIGEVCVAEAQALGYSFLIEALRQLLSDPYSAERAFANCTPENWRRRLQASAESACRAFAEELRTSEAVRRLREISGADGDGRESVRRACVAAVDAILGGDLTAAEVLAAAGLRGGSASKYPPENLTRRRL